VKWAAIGAGALVAWRYVVRPWRARRAATRLVKLGTKVSSDMEKAMKRVVALLAKLKVQADVVNGVHGGKQAVLVKPSNRSIVQHLKELLPSSVNHITVAVV